MNLHSLIIPQACQQLGRDEEILAGVLLAGNFNHAFMNHTLVAGIHSLIDFIDNSERGASKRLQG
jgi:hypothetical protein